jgi:uncharacterized membrane protein
MERMHETKMEFIELVELGFVNIEFILIAVGILTLISVYLDEWQRRYWRTIPILLSVFMIKYIVIFVWAVIAMIITKFIMS